MGNWRLYLGFALMLIGAILGWISLTLIDVEAL